MINLIEIDADRLVGQLHFDLISLTMTKARVYRTSIRPCPTFVAASAQRQRLNHRLLFEICPNQTKTQILSLQIEQEKKKNTDKSRSCS